MHLIRVFFPFVRNSIIRETLFQANFLIQIITRGFWFFAQIALFRIIYSRVPEINGWKESHADWHDDLIAMLKIIPETIHLRHLSLEHKIAIIERDQAREFTLSISGKAYGPTASADVNALKRKLGSVPPFCDNIAEIRVPIFRQDSDEDAAKTDRIFTIQCVYKPRLFKASK